MCDDDAKWLVVFEEVLVGASSAHFSLVLMVFLVGAVLASTLAVAIWHGPAWVRRLWRRGLRWRKSMVKSESLVRGGVMTMTLGDNLDFVVLLYDVCVSPCGWPGRPVLPRVGCCNAFSLVFH